MNTNIQRLFGLMMICFLVPATIAGDLTQAPMRKGISNKAILIAGTSLLLGAGFCCWKLINHYNRNALPKGISTLQSDGKTNTTVGIPGALEKIDISHGHLTLKLGTNPSLQVVTDNSALSIDQVAKLRGNHLRLLQHGSVINYILTLTKMPKVLATAHDSIIEGDEVAIDALELQTRDRSKIDIKNLTVNTLLSVHRTGSSSITTRGKWNVDVNPNRFAMHGNGGSTRLTKHNKDETILKIIASQGTSFGVSVS